MSIDGFQYVLSFTYDFSGQVMTYFLKKKSNTMEATKRFLSDCAPFGKIKWLRSDNGTEFTVKAFAGTKPNVKNMNIFGSTCYAYVQDKQKLDSRAKKGTFIAYDKYSQAYFIYFKDSRYINRVTCVKVANRFDNEKDD